ncbi:MAG: helical backbone metal receptor [Gemmatimonadota bacterium]|nr:helical backbone metal receptor [Gemmatimonadota bacterium]
MDTPLRSTCDVLRVAALLVLLPVLPSPASAQAPPVVDATGRSIEARPASFRRVASLVPSATDFIVALGAAGRLVARTRYDTTDAVSHAESVGEPLSPSREQLAAARPDLVVAWPRVRQLGLGTWLSELGATLFVVRPETMEGMQAMLVGLGRLLGSEPAADSLGAVLSCQLRTVGEAVTGRPKTRVAYLIWPDPLFAAGPDTYLDSLIRTAGGRNVLHDAASPWPQVSLESLTAADPDVLLLGSIEAGSSGWSSLRDHFVWPSLRAVRTDRVYELPAALFHRPGPQVGRAAAVLARRLHPEVEVPDQEICVPPTPARSDVDARPDSEDSWAG